MITYINDLNAQKYSQRFEEATQALVQAEYKEFLKGTLEDSKFLVFEKDDNGEFIKDKNGKKIPVFFNDQNLLASVDPIDSIEKYFYYLPQLIQLDEGAAKEGDTPIYNILHSQGRRFTILPILPSEEYEKKLSDKDERIFDIDANKRTITIPNNFSTNGVGVQGDQLAETIYFRIDRFFDAMDLDTADIFIQWVDADGNKGLSVPWVIDIESEPNKIIFGWAISSNVAKKAGNIQFSVRFYKWANPSKDTLSYSLATQTSTIAIKNSLDFEITNNGIYEAYTKAEKDMETLIISRIQSSESKITDRDIVKKPIFIVNMDTLKSIDDEHIVNNEYCVWDSENKILYADLIPEEDPSYIGFIIPEEGLGACFPIKLQAKSVDAGTLKYTWSKKMDGQSAFGELEGTKLEQIYDKNDNPIGVTIKPSVDHISTEYIETTDTEIKNKVYYKKDGDKYVLVSSEELKGASVLNGELVADTPASIPWYEKFSVCKANTVGEYILKVTNYKTNLNDQSETSYTCVVPKPMEPIFEQNLEEHVILRANENAAPGSNEVATKSLKLQINNEEANGTHSGKLSVKWFKKAIGYNEETGTSGYDEDRLKAINIPVKFEGITATPVPFKTDESYQPVLDENGKVIPIDEEGNEITDLEAEHIYFEVAVPEGGETSIKLSYDMDTVTELEDRRLDINEGIYFAQIFNTKNKETNDTLYSNDCRFSYAPEEPEITHAQVDKEGRVTTEVYLSDLMNEDFSVDDLTIGIKEDWINMFNISDGITYQWYSSSDYQIGEDHIIEGATSNSFKPVAEDGFQIVYCKITNHKNGEDATKTSPVFVIHVDGNK